MRLILLVTLLFHSISSYALTSKDEAFIKVGIEVFPIIIKSIKEPLLREQPVFIIYTPSSNNLAELASKQLAEKLDNKIHLKTQEELLHSSETGVIFITHPNLHNKDLINHAKHTKQLVFSPFINAVQQDIDVGISITEQVRIILNYEQVNNKNIYFKTFFYKIVKPYDQ